MTSEVLASLSEGSATRPCADPNALGAAAHFAIAMQLVPRAGVGRPIGVLGAEARIRFVKAKGVIECAGAALRATIAVARRLDVKEFAQCADVGSLDAGHYCSLVLRSAVRRLTPEVAGAAVAVPFIRCRSSSPIRCRPRLCTTRRIGAGTVGREPIAVAATTVAGIGDLAGGTW
jgi:hypothetical protein